MYESSDLFELFEERAAVAEFDGGLSRADAEEQAFADIRRMVGFDTDLGELQGLLDERNCIEQERVNRTGSR